MFFGSGLGWRPPVAQTRFCDVREIGEMWLGSRHCFIYFHEYLGYLFEVSDKIEGSLLPGQSSLFNEPNVCFVFMSPPVMAGPLGLAFLHDKRAVQESLKR